MAGNLRHLQYIFISNCLHPKRDVAICFVKITYFSDGCAAQYINKIHVKFVPSQETFSSGSRMAVFCHITWESACDWLGGTVTRLCNDQTLTPEQLFE